MIESPKITAWPVVNHFISILFLQVTYSFCKEFLQVLLIHVGPEGELCTTEVMRRVFEKSGKARYTKTGANVTIAVTAILHAQIFVYSKISSLKKICA